GAEHVRGHGGHPELVGEKEASGPLPGQGSDQGDGTERPGGRRKDEGAPRRRVGRGAGTRRFAGAEGSLQDLLLQALGLRRGKRITSRIEAASVRSMARRSMPIPSPAVGGMPCSRAWM